MTAKELPSPELVRKLLDYDPETGRLTWKYRGPDIEPSSSRQNTFNKQFGGKPAFTAVTAGYRVGRIFDVLYKSHRVIWAIVYGEWPEKMIDHINGDRSDNRLCNLRLVTPTENLRNAKRHSHNTSGHTGVHWYKAYGKWSAHITVGKKTKCLGYFFNIQDAVAARKEAEKRLSFHENHGRIS